jgi:diguanylate cyclase (GGDEF)-like protein
MDSQDWLEQTVTGNSSNSPSYNLERIPYLVVYAGNDQGKRFLFSLQPMTIGRSPDADIVLNDKKVSKFHCIIHYNGASVTIRDNNSTNGVFVDGRRITTQIEISNSHILVGDTALKIDYKNPEELMYEDDLIRKATTDPLCAIPNRSYFQSRAHEEVAYAKRTGIVLGLCMIDIDLFKSVNDTYGHQAGDYVIGQIARLLYAGKRTEDILARYGGEEFIILIRGIKNNDDAQIMCERMRKSVADFPFSHGDHSFRVTLSTGLYVGSAEEDSLESMIHKADTALYAAKHNGRNRVEIA